MFMNLKPTEIEEAKECLSEIIVNTYAEGKAKKLDNLRKYIEALEFNLKLFKAVHKHDVNLINNEFLDKKLVPTVSIDKIENFNLKEKLEE